MISFIIANEVIHPKLNESGYSELYLPERGWGNGYVAIPKSANHPWFGKGYDVIPVNVHGGLTFARSTNDYAWHREWDEEHWVVGFDTAHGGDGPHLDEEWVKNETENLRIQLVVISAIKTTDFYILTRCPYCNFINKFDSTKTNYDKYKEINCELCTKLYYAFNNV